MNVEVNALKNQTFSKISSKLKKKLRGIKILYTTAILYL